MFLERIAAPSPKARNDGHRERPRFNRTAGVLDGEVKTPPYDIHNHKTAPGESPGLLMYAITR